MNLHSAPPNTPDAYSRPCVSIDPSNMHSVVSMDTGHLRVGTSHHVVTIVGADVDDAELVDDPTFLGEH